MHCELCRAAEGTAPRTIQNDIVGVRMIVIFARSRKLVASDPLDGLKIKKVKPPRRSCWTLEECVKILNAVKGPYYDVFLLWADTGMRFAEAAWLLPSDLDFANNSVLIQEKDGWKPKNGEERAIPMTPRVRAMLERRESRHRWLFTMQRSKEYPNGDHQLQESRNLAYVKRRLKRLKLTGKIHDFRHSLITRALVDGIPEAVVREWAGHIDKDTIKLYTHISGDASQKARQKFAAGNSAAQAKRRPIKIEKLRSRS
jgi:integrase